jgi:hypothetical protein
MKIRNSNGHTGRAGEHAVALELELRKYSTALTRLNALSIDILAMRDGGKPVSIQVKASTWEQKNSSKQLGWDLRKESVTDGVIYVFVSLKQIGTRPDFYVLTSDELQNSKFRWPDTRSFICVKDLTVDCKERWDKIDAAAQKDLQP